MYVKPDLASDAKRLNWRAMAKPGPLIKSQYETLAAFRYALRRFIRFSEGAAQADGITAQQYQALLAIKGFPARHKVTVGELAERLQVRHHSAVGLIDRLVAEKLVVRLPSAEDRRQVLIQLTRRGEAILGRLASVHREQLKRIGPEIRQLLGWLGRTGE
jgi:DNA-binding MarR family transcriptional regulator